jgi:amphi-Trp domain-containing protein
MTKSAIAIKGCMDQADLAELLEGVVASFKAGTVCVRKGSEFVTLKPSGRLYFEIEAEIKKGRQSLAVEVKWLEEPQAKQACEPFSISATEPEFEPEPAPQATETPGAPEPAPAAPMAPGQEAPPKKKK